MASQQRRINLSPTYSLPASINNSPQELPEKQMDELKDRLEKIRTYKAAVWRAVARILHLKIAPNTSLDAIITKIHKEGIMSLVSFVQKDLQPNRHKRDPNKKDKIPKMKVTAHDCHNHIDSITQKPISKKYAVVYEDQCYDARSLQKWFDSQERQFKPLLMPITGTNINKSDPAIQKFLDNVAKIAADAKRAKSPTIVHAVPAVAAIPFRAIAARSPRTTGLERAPLQFTYDTLIRNSIAGSLSGWVSQLQYAGNELTAESLNISNGQLNTIIEELVKNSLDKILIMFIRKEYNVNEFMINSDYGPINILLYALYILKDARPNKIQPATSIVSMLLNTNILGTFKDNFGNNALHYAAKTGYSTVISSINNAFPLLREEWNDDRHRPYDIYVQLGRTSTDNVRIERQLYVRPIQGGLKPKIKILKSRNRTLTEDRRLYQERNHKACQYTKFPESGAIQ